MSSSASVVNRFLYDRFHARVDSMTIGQLPQNIALRLKNTGVKVLGTDPDMIDNAEDRHKFSEILDRVGVDQPEWTEVTSLKAAKEFSDKVG